MGKKDLLLGIDMGTSSVKAGLFDLQGKAVAFADESYPLYTPKSGWAEQNPDEWWSAICKAVRRLAAGISAQNCSIIGIGLDTTCCTVLAADKHFDILRPAVMWMDIRAAKQAKAITATKNKALKYNGFGNVSAESMPSKALWLKENEPEIYNQAEHIFECTDWLTHKLTGELTASIDTTSTRWYYDRANGGWPSDFYDEIGLEDVIKKFPKDVIDMGALVGRLTAAAAEELGLKQGIPVGEGGADAFVGMIGLNVVRPGSVALITGSSHLHLGLCENEMHKPGMWGSYPDAVIPGLQLVEGGQTSTGSIVNWFKNNFCGNLKDEASVAGESVYDLLNKNASVLPVGAEGLIALDYFQGNRTPYADPNVRGMFYGMSLNHTVYHLYRSIIESICYGTEVIFDTFKKGGMDIGSVYISGGAVKSDFWVKTHANVSNLPIYIPEVTEAPCLGSAILAAVACGEYPDIQTAAQNMVTIKDKVEPDIAVYEEYQFYFHKYHEIYNMMKNWMNEIAQHINN
jgi:FGGY-family pentulose kinase